MNQFFRMGLSIHNINYLHGKHVYQEGKVRVEQGLDWAFDTYIYKDTQVRKRKLEKNYYFVDSAFGIYDDPTFHLCSFLVA